MIPSTDSFNVFQYRLYWELQQSKLYTTYRGLPRYKYYRALSYVSLYLEIFIIRNLKIHYR